MRLYTTPRFAPLPERAHLRAGIEQAKAAGDIERAS